MPLRCILSPRRVEMGALEEYLRTVDHADAAAAMYISSLELVSRVSPAVAGRIVRLIAPCSGCHGQPAH